jgi:hypothetical protein
MKSQRAIPRLLLAPAAPAFIATVFAAGTSSLSAAQDNSGSSSPAELVRPA